jgi:hypothetical protein
LDDGGNTVGESIEVGTIQVRGVRPVSLEGVTKLAGLSFEDRISLIGYKLANSEAKPGNYFRLLLYWQATQEMSEEYAVFVHLVDEQGETWAQGDGLPASGIYPTWAWPVGEVVEDEHLIPLDMDVPAGTYHVWVGLYEPDTLSRLGVTYLEGTSFEDHVVLPVPLEVLSP